MGSHETLVESARLILGAITFLAIIGYILYGGLYRTFQRVGFTPGEAGLILLGTFVGAFIDIPLFRVNGWTLGINVGGALVPLAVTYLLLRRRPDTVIELIASTTVVALVTYLVTDVREFGIVSEFPLYLLPPIAAAAMSLGAFWREESFAAPLAYMAGTLGAIIGADVFRLPEFLAQAPPPDGRGFASIGGAAVLDMVYLTGVIAVALDTLFFSQVHRRQETVTLPYHEYPVFTTATPSDFIAQYTPQLRETPTGRPGPSRPQAQRQPQQRPPASQPPRPGLAGPSQPGRPPPASTPPQQQQPSRPPPTSVTTPEDPRLARHREWEARLRGRRP